MSKEKVEKRKAQLVYMGRRLSTKGKLCHFYCEIENHSEQCGFSTPLGSSPRGKDIIGGVYEGEMSEEEGITRWWGRWEYTRKRISNEEAIVEWDASDVADMAEYNAKKSIKKSKAVSAMKDRLRPLQIAYHNASPVAKKALLVEFITIIMKTPNRG